MDAADGMLRYDSLEQVNEILGGKTLDTDGSHAVAGFSRLEVFFCVRWRHYIKHFRLLTQRLKKHKCSVHQRSARSPMRFSAC